MRRLLWVGDACVASGFARATHHTLDVLLHTWDVYVLGLNHYGDPHPYPYPVYPAMTGGDYLGVRRLAKLVQTLQIDVVVLQNDVWHIPGYLKALKEAELDVPVVGSIAVDGKNCQGFKLNGLSLAIFWTAFAETEARKGGYTGPSVVIPLGVDLDIYRRYDQKQARAFLAAMPGSPSLAITEKTFIVGNLNRNQMRKRFDLMVEYFCDWLDADHPDDVVLMLHACPTGETEYDVEQLMTYRGYRDRLVMIKPDIGQGIPEKYLPITYSCMDVYFSTTQGEGMGLPALEAMACGIPCILPDWAAYGDWARDAAWLVPCSSHAATTGRLNVIGGIPDGVLAVEALRHLYGSPELRERYRQRAWERIAEPRFRWQNIGTAFQQAMDDTLHVPMIDEQTWQDMEVTP